MKRFVSCIILAAMLAAFVCCAAPAGDPNEGLAVIPVSSAPTSVLTAVPTEIPTAAPTEAPTEIPTEVPTERPTDAPTETPTAVPTEAPTETPTAVPTEAPTANPATASPDPTDTPAPTAAPTPAPTPAPTATPEPTSDGSIVFYPSASLPLPSLNEDVPHGQPFCFGGVVKSTSPLLSVSAVIYSGSNAVLSASVSFSASENRTAVELVDRTFPSSGDNSLTKKLKFENLPVGEYVFSLSASNADGAGVTLYTGRFRVVKSEWIQLISNNFRNNYAYALSFFGSRDEFMFRYKWADNRNITVEPSWVSTHYTSVTSPSGKTWYVHKKAAAGFNKAIAYMKTTYIRVGGAHDSGIVKLSSLIGSFDGTLCTRFVTDRTFISHHSFGTAIDLNASMDANRNVLTNRALILSEVRDHLIYNGIKEYGGVRYYDFTYTGSHSSLYNNIPTTVINYLLYELAFYRAGFGWGYYYDHACDGMHFTLSELSPDLHNSSSRALRKVYQYI